jgi:hypothetical protein
MPVARSAHPATAVHEQLAEVLHLGADNTRH